MQTPPHTNAKPNTLLILLLMGIMAMAFYLRMGHLESRPLHCDEANNTIIFKNMIESGHYIYNPADGHGPLMYLVLLGKWYANDQPAFADITITFFRSLMAAVGMLTIGLLWRLRNVLGVTGLLTSALLLTLSTCMTFYNRYFIHETLFIFMILLTFTGGLAYVTQPSRAKAMWLGVVLSLTFALKETCVITWAAMLGAAGLIYLHQQFKPYADHWVRPEKSGQSINRFRLTPSHLLYLLGGALAIWVLLYSWFFTNMQGLADSIKTFVMMFDRSQAVHQHPWWRYFQWLGFEFISKRMWWSEGLILLLSFVGIIAAFLPSQNKTYNKTFARFIALYTIFCTAAFCIIGYKTPWNVMPFLLGMILCAGIGVQALASSIESKWLKVVLLLLLLGGFYHLFTQTQLTNSRRFESDGRNPWVYAHSTRDVEKIANRALAISQFSPAGNEMIIQVFADHANYWPYPWYLRQFKNTGYFPDNKLTIHPDAAIIIADDKHVDKLDKILGNRYHTERMRVRPYVHQTLYIKKDLWEKLASSWATTK